MSGNKDDSRTRRDFLKTGAAVVGTLATPVLPGAWAAGTEGTPVRLTGQDVERGTFSQRHLKLHASKNGAPAVPGQPRAGAEAP